MTGRDAAPTTIRKLLIAFFDGTLGSAALSQHFRDSTKIIVRVVTYCFIELYGSLHAVSARSLVATLARDDIAGCSRRLKSDRVSKIQTLCYNTNAFLKCGSQKWGVNRRVNFFRIVSQYCQSLTKFSGQEKRAVT